MGCMCGRVVSAHAPYLIFSYIWNRSVGVLWCFVVRLYRFAAQTHNKTPQDPNG
jgi:hypothetical protein